MLIGAGIDGRGGMPAVFDGLPMERPVTELKLNSVRQYGSGAVWLRYAVKKLNTEGNSIKYQNQDAFEKANMFGTGTPNTAYAQYFIGNLKNLSFSGRILSRKLISCMALYTNEELIS